MEWDQTEPTSTRQARLMVASPEYVYESLAAYGKHLLLHRNDGDEQLEQALFSRNDPIINLALARFCTSSDILRTIYLAAPSPDNKEYHAKYYLGLRLACLSNQNKQLSKWRGFDFTNLIQAAAAEIDDQFGTSNFRNDTPSVDELYELLSNQSVSSDILVHLFEKDGPYKNISQQAWLRLVGVAARNKCIAIDDSNEWGPDIDAWDLQKAVSKFLEVVPINEPSFHLTSSLIEAFDTSNFRRPDNGQQIIERWLGATNLDEDLSKYTETYTKLCAREELACHLVALLGNDKLASSKLNSKVWGPNKAQILRCYKYGQKSLNPKDLAKAIKKDGMVCIMVAIRNNSILKYNVLRSLLEPHMSRYIAYKYINRLKQINLIDPKYSLRPVTVDFYEEHEIQPENHGHLGPEITNLRNKVSEIAGAMGKLETKSWIIGVLLVILLYSHWK